MEKYNHEYNAEQIQVLEGLEAVRKRPGMYIGSVSIRGLHHLVYEIVDNCVDEALAGYCTHIHIIIEKGNIISVEDDGRGIPVDIHPKTHISAAETVLFTGTEVIGESSVPPVTPPAAHTLMPIIDTIMTPASEQAANFFEILLNFII